MTMNRRRFSHQLLALAATSPLLACAQQKNVKPAPDAPWQAIEASAAGRLGVAVLDTADGVNDVCAFAYEGDPVYGENIGVAIVVPDATDARLLAMYRHAGERLAKHQMPVRWYLVDTLPRTARGKINRERIGAHCASLPQIDWRRIFGSAA